MRSILYNLYDYNHAYYYYYKSNITFLTSKFIGYKYINNRVEYNLIIKSLIINLIIKKNFNILLYFSKKFKYLHY